ncbi:MAG TPA: SOS response-associated peptidase family protein, partial [Gemmatimonadaceae bacterium]
ARIHNRMPVIVPDSVASEWLSTTTPASEIREIIAESRNELLAYPVSTYVNAPMNDGATCWERDEGEG